MRNKCINRSVKLAGVIGPQDTWTPEKISLFTDNENEFPIVADAKGKRLVNLIGQRVEIEGELFYSWRNKDFALKVKRFALRDFDEPDYFVRMTEPALPYWELTPGYA
ncbi:MAG TPA: hypothetical protein VFV50_19265 [Bdellovibrionales bacterium]|nr:hypothetical protein [Bdellovibrionales bacterium]